MFGPTKKLCILFSTSSIGGRRKIKNLISFLFYLSPLHQMDANTNTLLITNPIQYSVSDLDSDSDSEFEQCQTFFRSNV